MLVCVKDFTNKRGKRLTQRLESLTILKQWLRASTRYLRPELRAQKVSLRAFKDTGDPLAVCLSSRLTECSHGERKMRTEEREEQSHENDEDRVMDRLMAE